MTPKKYKGYGLEAHANNKFTVVRAGDVHGEELSLEDALGLIERLCAKVTIPDGTTVRFLRPEHNLNHYEATILNSHKLYGGGHHYELKCMSCPSIIGFAHDEELFCFTADADYVLGVAKNRANAEKREKLLAMRADIDAQLKALEA